MLMITAFVFLSYSVNATTYNPTTYNSFSDAVTYNNVTYYVKVTQLKALSEGTSMLPGGMETIMLVQLQMTNNSSIAKACTLPKLSIDISDERVISDVYTYGGDFVLGLLTGGTVVFYPSSDFSLDNNKVIVPPNKSLYCVGAIGIPAQLNQAGNGTLDTGLRNVHLYDKSNYNVTDSSSSYGNPVDLSPVISAIEDLGDSVDAIIPYLSDMIDLLTYEGTGYTQNIEGSSNFTDSFTSGGVTCNLERKVYPSVLITDDIEIDSGNDTILETGTKRYYVALYLNFNNTSTSTKQIAILSWVKRAYMLGTTYFPVIDSIVSDEFEVYTLGTNGSIYLYRKNKIGDYSYINPGPHRTFIMAHIDVPANVDLTFDDPGMDRDLFNRYTPVNSDVYMPNNEYMILRDLYLAYSSVNGLDDSSDISNDVADVSDSNHIIEESYYSANASAIEATGLSNYRFSNEQNNGIGKVADDFMLLWNALGSWNGVYIFSLTMALATFIMRHGGLFTVKRQTSDKGGESE